MCVMLGYNVIPLSIYILFIYTGEYHESFDLVFTRVPQA